MPKISALPPAASVNLTDILPEVSPAVGGTTYKATFQQVLTAYQGQITSLGAQTQALNMNSHLINNVTDPSSPQDAATKNYVDQTALNGTSVFAATTATLNATQAGAGVGATLTDASGTFAAFTVDGQSPAVGDYILNKDQTAAANRGIYKLTQNGDTISIPWVLTRSTTYDTPAEINRTGLIAVQAGSANGGTAWYNTTKIVTVDTTAFSYSRFGVSFPLVVSNGGTGLTSATAYAVLTGGTTSTGAFQSVASVGTASQVLTSNGAGALPTFQGTIQTVKRQIFGSTTTYTPSAGMIFCIVEVVAGGGAGGGASSSAAGNASAGAGGAGGVYGNKLWTAANVGASAAIVIGAAGTAGTAGNNPGNAGGNSTVTPSGTGSVLTCTGGAGGAGMGTSAGITISAGGAAGTATNFDYNIAATNGGKGYILAAGTFGVGGGGGYSFFTGPGVQLYSASGASPGQNIGSTGMGGGGAVVIATASDQAGAVGRAGTVIITEFCSQ